MSASLDKSLDDIISSSKKTFKGGNKRQGSKFGGNKGNQNKVGKKLVGNKKKKPSVSFNRPTAPKPVATPAFDLSYATKVNVSGLPKDLKQDNIKEFFQSQVGGVQTVALSYNERGQFKGFATVIFKSSKNATLAVEKYNGASIDGGAAKLRLELIIDTSKKPLAARIAAKPVQRVQQQQPNKADHKKKLLAKKNVKKPAKKPQHKKKTVEELDQEMADYFDN
ncbi:YRA1 [Candida jiufengensis]|uniref:YRA1 n=1 Tax=Candida jiufengensis TaxID=497108 RepID=UPI0022246155|nr:YRA1 [Candida jiufengensis]KAI5952430.1 YRA1 [Candida jiufengensis]